ncbi:PaaX family transcriptional regulator C-terminal domain-containing protein [Granulicoccus sp. GXG6511]|uniref:PaaX family transcriptional regulator C-terminal domain-containing protein n=1 Tax=Granulicoccus sp. GXG6511 TaxID=3381351 RepID=UPI003D7E6919
MAEELERYTPAFGKVPLAFGTAEARALPGPILIELVRAMDGASEAATKSLLHRMVGFGLLDVERVGRVGVYRLAGRMLVAYEKLRDGARLRSPEPWTGAFHTILYDIPETRRALRDRLRAAAFRLGYRQLRPGVLISPTDESLELETLIEPGLLLLRGRLEVDLPTARRIAAIAWELDRHGALRRQAFARLEATTAATELPTGPELMRLWHEVVQPFADVRFNDGDLPPELLPEDWPGAALQDALGRTTARLAGPLDNHVRAVLARSPHAGLVEPDRN